MFGPEINLIFAALLTLGVGWWLRGRVRRHDWPLAAAFLLAVALTGFFGFRMVDRALYWTNPAHAQQMPEGWMTIRYLARSWHLPPDELAGTIGLGKAETRGRRLSEIAQQQGIPLAALIARLNARLAAETPRKTPPPPGPGE